MAETKTRNDIRCDGCGATLPWCNCKHLRHQWGFDGIDMFDCIHDDCNERMDMDEAEKRLNATECLNAEDAREAAEWPSQIFNWDIAKALTDYANDRTSPISS